MIFLPQNILTTVLGMLAFGSITCYWFTVIIWRNKNEKNREDTKYNNRNNQTD